MEIDRGFSDARLDCQSESDYVVNVAPSKLQYVAMNGLRHAYCPPTSHSLLLFFVIVPLTVVGS